MLVIIKKQERGREREREGRGEREREIEIETETEIWDGDIEIDNTRHGNILLLGHNLYQLLLFFF